jgi:PKD repeat protein
MKQIKLLSPILFLLFFLAKETLTAQCQAGFNYTIGPNNTVTFVSTSTPAVANTTYSWTFGAGYIPPFQGVGPVGTQTAATYTSNGVYNVNLTITNTVPFCIQTFTAAITITTCPVFFNSVASSTVSCTGASTATGVGFCGPVTYSWIGVGAGATQNNLCPGSYTVLAAGSNPSCCPQGMGVVVISTLNPCPLNASFQHTLQQNGLVDFRSTSSGTLTGSQYVWNFGDNTGGSNVTTSHTYSAPGAYQAFLTVINNSITCRDTSVVQIITPFFCNLTLSATAAYTGSSTLLFNGSAAGTNTSSSYFWRFGDGTSGSGISASHTYSVPGTYSVIFRVSNNTIPSCVDSLQLIINSHCGQSSNFTHTVGSNGMVTFNSASGFTVPGTSYLWDFGDGFGDITPHPVHQYTNGGTHYAKLKINRPGFPTCSDSTTQAINITGVNCSANAFFSLSPSGIPQQWTALPVYPFNVSTAVWNWGDGSTTTGMFPSHTYAVAGNYSICLSVTLSCNATASYCVNQFLSRGEGAAIILVNVQRPELKLGVMEGGEVPVFTFYPNPNQGRFTLKTSPAFLHSEVRILDLSGRVVAGPMELRTSEQEFLLTLAAGFYVIDMKNESGTVQKKMIVD